MPFSCSALLASATRERALRRPAMVLLAAPIPLIVAQIQIASVRRQVKAAAPARSLTLVMNRVRLVQTVPLTVCARSILVAGLLGLVLSLLVLVDQMCLIRDSC